MGFRGAQGIHWKFRGFKIFHRYVIKGALGVSGDIYGDFKRHQVSFSSFINM